MTSENPAGLRQADAQLLNPRFHNPEENYAIFRHRQVQEIQHFQTNCQYSRLPDWQLALLKQALHLFIQSLTLYIPNPILIVSLLITRSSL